MIDEPQIVQTTAQPAAVSELMSWIAAEGHTAAPNLWACSLTGPESGPETASWRTELNRPLTAALSAAA